METIDVVGWRVYVPILRDWTFFILHLTLVSCVSCARVRLEDEIMAFMLVVIKLAIFTAKQHKNILIAFETSSLSLTLWIWINIFMLLFFPSLLILLIKFLLFLLVFLIQQNSQTKITEQPSITIGKAINVPLDTISCIRLRIRLKFLGINNKNYFSFLSFPQINLNSSDLDGSSSFEK